MIRMPGGLKARIVVPLVGIFLLTVAGGYFLAEVFVGRELQHQQGILSRRQKHLEEEVMTAARAVARIPFAPQTDRERLRILRDILGHPFALFDEAGVIASTLTEPEAASAELAADALSARVRDRPESVGDMRLAERAMRAVWTPVPAEVHSERTRPRWVIVFVPPEATAVEPPLWRPFAGIALAGATVLAAAAYAVSWFWARRVQALARTVDSWLPESTADGAAPSPAAGPAGSDEVTRLSAAFEHLRVRIDHYRRELVARERLATAGSIAAMMAHEIRNPLTALKLSAQMLREDAAGEAADTLDVMLREISRLQILCDQLLTLSGRRNTVREPVELDGIVADVCRLLSGQAERGKVRLTVRPSTDRAPMSADGNELRQLVMNLVLNALEASPENSEVVVETARQDGRRLLRVIDHGPGIAAPAAAPNRSGLLSNKPGGAGLGLAICEKIVQHHGGTLSLINRGDGTTAEAGFPADVPAR
jgi:signal transduction histidine kinase